MKNLSLLVWITQLGLSVAVPLCGFAALAAWLQNRFHLGSWVMVIGIALGLVGAVSGFRSSLAAMNRMADSKPDEPPPVSFNDHD